MFLKRIHILYFIAKYIFKMFSFKQFGSISPVVLNVEVQTTTLLSNRSDKILKRI